MTNKINEDEIKNTIMSNEMLKNCKSEIAKFGFDNKEYVKFLISVNAMKDGETVLKYRNDEIEKYREIFIKKFEYSIGDSFQLDKAKIMTSDFNGKKYQTGYFCPRSFWDSILNSKER